MQLTLPSPYTEQSKKLKTRVSLQQALLFAILANPFTFRFVGKTLGSWASSPSGCPTSAGLLLHSVIFGLTDFGLMKLSV